jgi:hypothetical protein
MQTFKEMIYARFEKGENDEDQLNPEEVFRHGMESGFSGFIYYTETTEMFDKYAEDIWKIFEDYDAPFPAQENRTLAQWKNAMVWGAVEVLAGIYLEQQHQEMEERIAEDAAGGDRTAKAILGKE